MTPQKVNRETREIPKEISGILESYVKIPIIDIIERLKELHNNGYVSLELKIESNQFYGLKTIIYRFETEKEQESRIAKEEKIIKNEI